MSPAQDGCIGFTLDRDFLIKNMGFCCRCSSSLNKVALTETS